MAEFDLSLSFLIIRSYGGMSVLCFDLTMLGKNTFKNRAGKCFVR